MIETVATYASAYLMVGMVSVFLVNLTEGMIARREPLTYTENAYYCLFWPVSVPAWLGSNIGRRK